MSELTLRLNKSRAHLAVSLESIDFQTDNFGSQLEAILYDMEKFVKERKGQNFEETRTALQKSDFPKILAACIFKRLGIKVTPIFNTDSFGAVMPFFINENHVLLQRMWRGHVANELPDQAKVLKTLNGKSGTVDLKNARLTGIFSEYEHDLWLDVAGHFLAYNSTVPEVTAILLHELGHAFTYYELGNRLEETNQILAQLSVEMRGGNNAEKKKVLFVELAKSFGKKDDEFDDLVEEQNQTIFGLKFFKRYVSMVKSQLPNDKYNETASEQVADNFATRFGYGRHLITALDKITRMYGSPEASEGMARFAFIYELIMMHIIPLVQLLSLFTVGITAGGLLGPLLWIFMFVNSGDDSEDMTYDRLKMRYKRVRQQYIEMIQKLKMDKEHLRKVVDDIHFIDEIIQNTSIYRSIFSRLANFVFTKSKEAKKDVELQYLIEELTHSDLFLKSAELTVIS